MKSAIAFFNKPQRNSDRTIEIFQAIAFFNEPQKNSDRTIEIFQAIAYYNFTSISNIVAL
ncbi:MAG: hypothetical protein V7K32_21675 [Nostoc sp.]|uniref:hypothetical protein n=1 Tax=Nostoc sp. TaxID=1180 RepID=UPI002FFBF502